MAAAVAGGGRRGGVRDRAGPDVQGGDVRVHHQGEVRGLAQAGVHCRQEKGQTNIVPQPGGKMDLTLIMFQVTKFTTMTGCNKEPTELCAPAGCGFREVRCLHIILKLKIFAQMF